MLVRTHRAAPPHQPLPSRRFQCRLLHMSTVTEIGEAIRKLPPQEAWKLAADLREYLDGLWDKQFEGDVKAGRLDNLIARAREEHAGGKARPMDEIVGDE